MLNAALEISAQSSFAAGAIRMCYAAVFVLFIGFSVALGMDLVSMLIPHSVVYITDYKCTNYHDPHGPWWQRPVTVWFGM